MRYVRPSSVAEASEIARANPEAKILAGGQSLLPSMRLGLASPNCLIDLQDIAALRHIEKSGDVLRIGAMASHACIARDPLVQRWTPFLARLASGIGDQQVRHMGTIGGSLANNDPAACWPAGVLAANANIITSHTTHKADDYFVDLFLTSLAANEIITAIEIDVSQGPITGAYEKFEQLASRFALTGVALVRTRATVRIAITGLGSGVKRWHEAEQALSGRFDIAALEQLRVDDRLAYDDLHASARYRAHLASVLTQRCVSELST
jgi:aerobic carbon-monoxide dehydrogenase medium subunit